MYNSVVFTNICNHHQCLITFLSPQNWSLYYFVDVSHFPLRLSLVKRLMYFLSLWICLSWTFVVNGIIHSVAFFIWFLLVKIIFSRFIHVVLSGHYFIIFFMAVPHFVCSSLDRHLGSHFLAIMNSASGNTCIRVSAGKKVFGVLECIPRRLSCIGDSRFNLEKRPDCFCKVVAAFCLLSSTVWGDSCSFHRRVLQEGRQGAHGHGWGLVCVQPWLGAGKVIWWGVVFWALSPSLVVGMLWSL